MMFSLKKSLGKQDRQVNTLVDSLPSTVRVMPSTAHINVVSMNENEKSGKTVVRKHTSVVDTAATVTSNYIVANNPARMGELNTFSAGNLEEMLDLCAIYFQFAELYESPNIEMVMIKYE
jgi:hypothetical protein